MSGDIILVVDDNRQVVDFLAFSLLPKLGYQTLVAYTGRQALKVLSTSSPALMLLDLELDDTNGLDLLRQLSKIGRFVPTIIITAHGSEQVAVEALRLGVQDFLIKPLDIDTLDAAITKALTETRLLRETERLNSELKERMVRQNMLMQVGRSVTSILRLDDVLCRIVEAGVSLTQAQEGFLALMEPGSNQLFLRAARNIDAQKGNLVRLPVQDSLSGKVLKTRQPVRASVAPSEPGLKVVTGFLVRSLLHVPIISKDQALGVLSVDNPTNTHPFSEDDERILTALADYASTAIVNARLYEQAQQEIAERKRVEIALRESEERYALAVRGANDGVWDWNLKTNEIYYSPRWKAMLGYDEEELSATPREWLARIHPDDRTRVEQDLAAHIKNMTPHFESEFRILHKDRFYRWMLCRGVAVRDKDQRATRVAGSQTDITARKDAEQKRVHDALHDSLTGLPNRALLMDHLQRSINQVWKNHKQAFAVLFLDLDNFKDINDSFGHSTGDQLLIQVSQALRQALRQNDVAARPGGDEFIILLEGRGEPAEVLGVASEIQKELAAIKSVSGHPVMVTASIGIVYSSPRYSSPEDILRDADIAMYRAKGRGKACAVVFEPAMRKKGEKRLALANDLNRALQQREFRLFYQPIVSLQEGRLVGLEALLRWQSPDHGLLMPEDFIPVLEDTGLIIPTGRWVLYEACRQINEWKAQFPSELNLAVNVNISLRQMLQPDLIDQILVILKHTRLAPQQLILEVTETALHENHAAALAAIKRLKELGVRVQIDNFGSGQASLDYLVKSPVAALKIDRNFVGTLAENNNMKVVRAIVNLTRNLGIDVVAKGVETPEQLSLLQELGCQQAQGFLVAQPLDSEATARLLADLRSANNLFTPWQRP